MLNTRLVLAASLLTPALMVSPGAAADQEHDHEAEHRQHGAHVHGIAALNLALEGTELFIELDSPAANIVGFEHLPSSEADHATLQRALVTLKDGGQLFSFNESADCRLETATVTSALLETAPTGREHDESGKHGDGEKHAHGHTHAHDAHEDAHGAGGETHADIEAVYQFGCERPEKLTRMTVELFKAFPGTERLDVQFVIEDQQGSAELSPSERVIEF